MKYLHRIRNTLCVLLLMNILLLEHLMKLHLPIQGGSSLSVASLLCHTFLVLVIVLFYIMTQLLPCYEKGLSFRLQVLSGGYELIVSSFYALALELAGYAAWLLPRWDVFLSDSSLVKFAVINAAFAYVVLLIHYLNGFWRTCFCSFQLGVWLRVLMFFFWWIPPVNIVLFLKWCGIVRRELYYERNKYLTDSARAENAVCRTRYPVVMVHGIFFRDWQYLNYWGRIPRELKKNGATVYYGRQQSSLCIADSAAELQAEIQRVLHETGAEKVNIIAHSKGGLDARYAITRLHMEDSVASLTTINTPHRGCVYADVLLKALPGWMVHYAAARYNSLFHKLGDNAPDFLAGIRDLTASSCAAFNENTPDSPKVYYQSAMSKMRSMRSAGFPLNLSYLLAKKYDGENDGLVGISSAAWGHFLGLLTAGRKGISHGDMIDLTHKNIKGFDVAEFYVGILEGLKEKGF